jgi:hypothetical protein
MVLRCLEHSLRESYIRIGLVLLGVVADLQLQRRGLEAIYRCAMPTQYYQNVSLNGIGTTDIV